MTFKEALDRADAEIFARLGQDVVYDDGVNPQVTVRGDFAEQPEAVDAGPVEFQVGGPMVEIRVAELASPKVGATITVQGRTYRIAAATPDNEGLTHVCNLERI